MCARALVENTSCFITKAFPQYHRSFFFLKYFLNVIFLLALLTILVFADTRSSANYTMKRESVNSGGTHQTSANYTVIATVGQSTPNVIGTSANYQITAGFQQPLVSLGPTAVKNWQDYK